LRLSTGSSTRPSRSGLRSRLGAAHAPTPWAIWLDKRKLMMHGEPGEVVNSYIKFVTVKKSATAMKDL
jgi:hypothetical protein